MDPKSVPKASVSSNAGHACRSRWGCIIFIVCVCAASSKHHSFEGAWWYYTENNEGAGPICIDFTNNNRCVFGVYTFPFACCSFCLMFGAAIATGLVSSQFYLCEDFRTWPPGVCRVVQVEDSIKTTRIASNSNGGYDRNVSLSAIFKVNLTRDSDQSTVINATCRTQYAAPGGLSDTFFAEDLPTYESVVSKRPVGSESACWYNPTATDAELVTGDGTDLRLFPTECSPVPVIIGWLFLTPGILGFLYGVKEFVLPSPAAPDEEDQGPPPVQLEEVGGAEQPQENQTPASA